MIQPATLNDIPALVEMINTAYRSPGSKKGWTTEADIIQGGIRVEAEGLKGIIERDSAVILKHTGDDHKITGCVYLQNKPPRLYLGLLTVSPDAQAQGIGRKLLQASEEHARNQQLTSIILKVVSIRKELIEWYERNGYVLTGEKNLSMRKRNSEHLFSRWSWCIWKRCCRFLLPRISLTTGRACRSWGHSVHSAQLRIALCR